jgi:hypothetical protein
VFKRILAEVAEVRTVLLATAIATAASLVVQELANLRDESLLVLGVAVAVMLLGLTAAAFARQLQNIHDRIDSLGQIEWTYENEEHEIAVYRKMTELVREPEVVHFYVLSVFKPLEQRGAIDKATHSALRDYYRALEDRTLAGGFTYRRAAILRSRLKDAVAQEHLLCDLPGERPSFVEHYKSLARSEDEDAQSVRFFRDDGRMLDVAFGLALDENGRPISLVIELGVTSAENVRTNSGDPRRALGLLRIPHPSSKLADPFKKVHGDVWAGRILRRIPADLVRDRLMERAT